MTSAAAFSPKWALMYAIMGMHVKAMSGYRRWCLVFDAQPQLDSQGKGQSSGQSICS